MTAFWGRALLVLAAACLQGCVSLKAYRELEFARQQEEKARLEAQENVRELQRKLAEERPSEAAIVELDGLRDKVVTLQKTVAKLQEDNLELLESGKGGTQEVAFEIPARVREDLRLEINPASGGIILRHDTLFEGSGPELKKSAELLLERLARALNIPELADRAVNVDGHTDSRPVTISRAVNPDNWVLGARRAAAVLDALQKNGVDRRRLRLRSFAYMRPLHATAPDSPDNRRVELAIGELSANAPPEEPARVTPCSLLSITG